MNSQGDQSQQIWVLLGELKGQLSAVHLAIETGASATTERLNQQSARIDKESERADKLAQRIQTIENSISRQSGGFSLAGWVLPLALSLLIGAASVGTVMHQTHVMVNEAKRSN
jgi:hypothetical protein